METFKMTKKMWIAWIFIIIGTILIISSFFIPDSQAQCNTGPILKTIPNMLTSTFFIFAIGMLFLIMGMALADVEYHNQTKWVIKRHHTGRKY